jgi:hypothetical protein
MPLSRHWHRAMPYVPTPYVRAPYVLYQRDDCHLCDLALAVLAEAGLPEFESVFIDGDDDLERIYGHRVPVLRDLDADVELDWPFDGATVAQQLGRSAAGERV